MNIVRIVRPCKASQKNDTLQVLRLLWVGFRGATCL